jgi:hypothetical protein
LFATTTTPKKIVCVDEMSITCCVIKIKNWHASKIVIRDGPLFFWRGGSSVHCE